VTLPNRHLTVSVITVMIITRPHRSTAFVDVQSIVTDGV